MRVFIENEAGSNEKHLFNKQTLALQKTVRVSRSYPYPYGFVIGTRSGDGDPLDCFILTTRAIASGQIVDVEPIGIAEQIDNGQEDHNLLAVFSDEPREVEPSVQRRITDFLLHVFDHKPDKVVAVGKFRSATAAQTLLKRCQERT